MLKEIILPRLGQTVETATIDNWRVKPGDTVKRGDILLEITTDKATLEVESFVDGTVLQLNVKEGDEVDVDQIIAYVGDPSDKPPAAPPPQQKREQPAEHTLDISEGTVALLGRASGVPISPRARKLAEEINISLLAIRGTGPGGRIVEKDVLAYDAELEKLNVTPTARVLAAQKGVDLLRVRASGTDGRITRKDVENATPLSAKKSEKRILLSPARKVIAQRMAQSKREIPHFYLQAEIDMTQAVELRSRLKSSGAAVTYNDIIIKAVASAFSAAPELNGYFADDCIVLHDTVDVGLAVAVDDGLLVPIVRHADQLRLTEISAQIAELIEKARTKRLAPFEYEGGSITISNLGAFGVTNFLPIINPGQSAILGVGQIIERPVVVASDIAVRKMMGVTLAVDHRVADGVLAAKFLAAIKSALESPDALDRK